MRTRQMKTVGIIATQIFMLSIIFVTMASANTEQNQESIAKGWIQAHNEASVDDMASFRTKHFKNSTSKDWQTSYENLVNQFGTLMVWGMMAEGPHKLRIGVKSEKTGEKFKLVFEFDSDAPDQIKQISIKDEGGREEGGNDLPKVKLSSDWSNRKSELDAYLQRLAKDDLFSGTVLVANSDGVLYEGACGLASREFNAANNLDTRFDVGSCNKDYTQVAIFMLADEGKLSLDDKVGKHLPDYPNADVRNKVTIQQLINHYSGLGDYFTDEWWSTPMSQLRYTEDYIPIWGPKPLLHEPGEREEYSNYGYTVLGAIIEELSGQRYHDFVMERIFKPAGMKQSGFFDTDAVVPNVAVGYTLFSPNGKLEEPIKNIYVEPAKGGPWGKSYSTVRDLYRFYAAMLDGQILEGDRNWLTGGWDGGSVALAGGGPGLNAMVFIDSGLMVVVLANMDPPIAGLLAEGLSRQLLQ